LVNKMLLGTDGRKMSTSWGNVINIIDTPDDQFGKVMSVRDDQIPNYFHLATDVPEKEIKKYVDGIKGGDNPKKVKEILAFEVAKRYHGEKAAHAAAENFAKTFSRREIPDAIPMLKINSGTILPVDLIVASGVFKSKSEARRLVEQGGFDVDNRPCRDLQSPLVLKGGEVIKVGKKRFFKVIL